MKWYEEKKQKGPLEQSRVKKNAHKLETRCKKKLGALRQMAGALGGHPRSWETKDTVNRAQVEGILRARQPKVRKRRALIKTSKYEGQGGMKTSRRIKTGGTHTFLPEKLEWVQALKEQSGAYAREKNNTIKGRRKGEAALVEINKDSKKGQGRSRLQKTVNEEGKMEPVKEKCTCRLRVNSSPLFLKKEWKELGGKEREAHRRLLRQKEEDSGNFSHLRHGKKGHLARRLVESGMGTEITHQRP